MIKDPGRRVKDYRTFFRKSGVDSEALETHYAYWQAQSGRTAVTDDLRYLFHVPAGETKKQVALPIGRHRSRHKIYLLLLEFRVNAVGQKNNALAQPII